MDGGGVGPLLQLRLGKVFWVCACGWCGWLERDGGSERVCLCVSVCMVGVVCAFFGGDFSWLLLG